MQKERTEPGERFGLSSINLGLTYNRNRVWLISAILTPLVGNTRVWRTPDWTNQYRFLVRKYALNYDNRLALQLGKFDYKRRKREPRYKSITNLVTGAFGDRDFQGEQILFQYRPCANLEFTVRMNERATVD